MRGYSQLPRRTEGAGDGFVGWSRSMLDGNCLRDSLLRPIKRVQDGAGYRNW